MKKIKNLRLSFTAPQIQQLKEYVRQDEREKVYKEMESANKKSFGTKIENAFTLIASTVTLTLGGIFLGMLSTIFVLFIYEQSGFMMYDIIMISSAVFMILAIIYGTSFVRMSNEFLIKKGVKDKNGN